MIFEFAFRFATARSTHSTQNTEAHVPPTNCLSRLCFFLRRCFLSNSKFPPTCSDIVEPSLPVPINYWIWRWRCCCSMPRSAYCLWRERCISFFICYGRMVCSIQMKTCSYCRYEVPLEKADRYVQWMQKKDAVCFPRMRQETLSFANWTPARKGTFAIKSECTTRLQRLLLSNSWQKMCGSRFDSRKVIPPNPCPQLWATLWAWNGKPKQHDRCCWQTISRKMLLCGYIWMQLYCVEHCF